MKEEERRINGAVIEYGINNRVKGESAELEVKISGK